MGFSASEATQESRDAHDVALKTCAIYFISASIVLGSLLFIAIRKTVRLVCTDGAQDFKARRLYNREAQAAMAGKVPMSVVRTQSLPPGSLLSSLNAQPHYEHDDETNPDNDDDIFAPAGMLPPERPTSDTIGDPYAGMGLPPERQTSAVEEDPYALIPAHIPYSADDEAHGSTSYSGSNGVVEMASERDSMTSSASAHASHESVELMRMSGSQTGSDANRNSDTTPYGLPSHKEVDEDRMEDMMETHSTLFGGSQAYAYEPSELQTTGGNNKAGKFRKHRASAGQSSGAGYNHRAVKRSGSQASSLVSSDYT